MMHHLTFSYNALPSHCLPSKYLNDLIPQYRCRRKRINAFCPWVRFFNNESVEELQSMVVVVDGVAAAMIAQLSISSNLSSVFLSAYLLLIC